MMRTLVVDDDPDVRALHVAAVDQTPGFVVVGEAATGLAAVDAAVRGGVDLVLLDITLPDVSGIEVLHRIRASTSADIDVVVLSASADATVVAQAVAAGIADYVVKPFAAGELSRRLQAVAGARGARRRAAAGPLGQEQIDALVTGGIPVQRRDPAPAFRALPKGLVEPTARRVLDALGDEPRSAAAVAELAGVSRITARRYLDRFRADGLVGVSHRYGRPGRPEVRYVRR